MNIIDRVKNILITPQKEWDVINGEQPNTPGIITGYVLPLAGAAAVAAFIGYGLIGVNFGFGIRIKGMDWGLYQGEVVGRLVEQQNVGGADQRLRNRDPFFKTAGQGGNQRVRVQI